MVVPLIDISQGREYILKKEKNRFPPLNPM